jgi:hypothetical protein
MKPAMRRMHGCCAKCCIAKSTSHRNIPIVSWEERIELGTKAMSNRFRPIHSGFETLRIAGDRLHAARSYHQFGAVANEQLTARGYGHITRPTAIFADFQER